MSFTKKRSWAVLAAAALTGGLITGLTGLSSATAASPNLALGKAVTVSSTEASGLEGGKAVDGSGTTRWASAEGVDNQWIRIDLGAGTSVGQVVLKWEGAYAKAYRVELSDDGSTWRQLYSTTAGDGGTDTLTVSGTGRYLRVYGTKRATSYGYSLYEVEVYGGAGTPTPTPTPTTPTPTTTTTPPGGGAAVPFGTHSFPYAAGTITVSGDRAANDAKVVDYYKKWKSAFVTSKCGNGWSAIASVDADHPYVAEGQGYGLTILATMAGADPDARATFDRLLKFVLDHPSVNNPDLHAAEQDAGCKSVNGSDSATDGDLEIAYALLLADKQWGSTTGGYNYKQLAVKRINAIKASEVVPGTRLMNLGDWSDGNYNTMSRSSDWLSGHFKAFRKATGDSAWDGILTAHQNLVTHLQTNYAPTTGLLPDFAVSTNTGNPKPAAGQVLESPLDGAYSWNACRDPWRLGVDGLTTGDPKSLAAVRKMNSWIKQATGGDPDRIAQGYKLNGTVAESGSSVAFIAPFAVAAATDTGSQAWLDALWTKMNSVPLDQGSYYGSSIQLQVMIAVTGNQWLP
ncbi:Glycosyl hydrolases family 8 [Streptomyces sp. TLI_053]|uniref:glycosyl hydrolase family 8 n=1 Tax=Streptomyces sp. TLI_053 TaxID=1855352 RepID=UPI00087C7BDF|nr:glycosyl hydrolase family 8 [Streptomyces sp. TLI_053]SDS82699.1 Glycosyl hydrolases family 8 [Streptomyces sp. TLI_053]